MGPTLNALLIPGGSRNVGWYFVEPFARALIDRAIQTNKKGEYFPVWGTCLGFEWLIQVVAANDLVLQDSFYDLDDPENLLFDSSAFPGRVFKLANASLRNWFASENITYNSHVLGIEPQEFKENSKLASTF